MNVTSEFKSTKSRLPRNLALAFGLLVGALLIGPMTASAAQKSSCIVQRVDTNGKIIALWCQGGGPIYYVHRVHSQCTTVGWNEMKLWLSQMQSALLSGKPLHLFYDPPAGGCPDNRITSVGLKL